MTEQVWEDAAQKLRASLGQNNFKSWIEPLKFCGVENDCATFNVPTGFFGNYVQQHFEDHILHQLRTTGVRVSRVSFAVRRAEKKAAAQNCAQKNVNQSTQQVSSVRAPSQKPTHSFQTAKLDNRFTFENFVVGKSNQLAYSAARRVAEGGPVTFNPLFLYGGVGLGKTHLMHAIAWEIQNSRPDVNVMYLSAEQFMYRFVQALRERKMMDFKEIFRSVDVLMIDDVQFIAGKDSTQEEFFHTFNALVDQGKQIIISADRSPSEIKHLEDRISSRLQCGLVVDFHPTSYELRLGILQAKIDLYRSSYPGVDVSDEVVDFLAHRISSSVRVLEGALTRLFAFASLVGRSITIELTQDCLADVLRANERKVTVEDIQRKVSDHYNIRLSDMLGPRRMRNFARPRQIAMYLCKQMTTRSLPEIGRRFGGRDHTTIMHGVKRVEKLRLEDSQLSDDINLLRRALEG